MHSDEEIQSKALDKKQTNKPYMRCHIICRISLGILLSYRAIPGSMLPSVTILLKATVDEDNE